MNKDQITNITYNYLHNYSIDMNHFEEICLMVEHHLSKTEYYNIQKTLWTCGQ